MSDEQREKMKIHVYPDPVLRARAEKVLDIDEETQTLIDGMITTMYAAPGIGLAANQVGNLARIIVFDLHPGEDRRSPLALINPEIVDGEGKITHEEACLSVVDFAAEVSRMAKVSVKGFDRKGKPVSLEAEDLLAICLQHEIDHLDGTLYIDHISSLKRALYKKKLKKRQKGS